MRRTSSMRSDISVSLPHCVVTGSAVLVCFLRFAYMFCQLSATVRTRLQQTQRTTRSIRPSPMRPSAATCPSPVPRSTRPAAPARTWRPPQAATSIERALGHCPRWALRWSSWHGQSYFTVVLLQMSHCRACHVGRGAARRQGCRCRSSSGCAPWRSASQAWRQSFTHRAARTEEGPRPAAAAPWWGGLRSWRRPWMPCCVLRYSAACSLAPKRAGRGQIGAPCYEMRKQAHSQLMRLFAGSPVGGRKGEKEESLLTLLLCNVECCCCSPASLLPRNMYSLSSFEARQFASDSNLFFSATSIGNWVSSAGGSCGSVYRSSVALLAPHRARGCMRARALGTLPLWGDTLVTICKMCSLPECV